MKKIRLEPETLKVESFHVAADGAPRGTVVGRSGTEHTDCWGMCGAVGPTEVINCDTPIQSDPRYGGCVYPTAAHHSCQPGETVDQNTCNCLYPDTDVRMCCTGQGCSGMC